MKSLAVDPWIRCGVEAANARMKSTKMAPNRDQAMFFFGREFESRL